MTQQEDREACERAAQEKGHTWPEGVSAAFIDGWQVVRDHYAPKVTEKEAIDLVQREVFEGNPKRGYAGAVIDALRAAGVRFKEEA
jgi:hypothetical protein